MSVSDMFSKDKTMYGNAKFKTAPIIDVTKENVSSVGALVRGAIIGADFIAIDCELSGLGNRKRLNATDLEERYQNTGNVAKTRSIISLGLSMFKLFKTQGQTEDPDFTFHVQTFNILTLCSEDYIVEPGSLKFLVEHGFDFCRQYAEGLPYFRGADRKSTPINEDFIRQVFMEIIRQKKPLVLHNGFIDLVFMYQNFYAQLPQTLSSFAADLFEMFPNGIYDTKYISDYVCRKPASFLEYVFRSQQRRNVINAKNGKSPYVTLIFPPTSKVSSTFVQQRGCDYESLFYPVRTDIKICASFSNHGHCPIGKKCKLSHDIDQVVLAKEANTTKNERKRKRQSSPPTGENVEKMEINTSSSSGETSDSPASRAVPITVPKPPSTTPCATSSEKPSESASSSSTSLNCGGHRAGFDAFMTGFSFATFIVHSTLIDQESSHQSEAVSNLLGVPIRPEFSDLNIVNRIYLVCKDIPFMIRKSAFARHSIGHSEKYNFMNSTK